MRALLLVGLLAACGPKVDMRPSPFEEDDLRAGDPVENEAPTYEELPIAPPKKGERAGTIARAELDAALDAGPAPILSRVEVTAEHDGDRFRGWRVVAMDQDQPPFPGVDLVPGDVLIAINGRSIARPHELEAVWTVLRTADEVVADLERDGGRFQLRWTVTE